MKKTRISFFYIAFAVIVIAAGASANGANTIKPNDANTVKTNGAAVSHAPAQQALADQTDPRIAEIAHPLPLSDSLSGNYLSGRFAQQAQDWDAAQAYMTNVTEFDDTNGAMRERAFLLAVGAGAHEKARALAQDILKMGGGDSADIAIVYMATDALARNDYTGAATYAAQLPDDGFGGDMKSLLSAWAQAGAGHYAQAQDILKNNAPTPDDSVFALHAGLIAEMQGDTKAAAEHYKIAMANGLSLHGALLIANFLEVNGADDVSKQIFDGLAKLYPADPFIGAREGMKARHKPNVARAADGAAFALFDIATLLFERHAYDSAQIYASIVQLLNPQSPFAALMQGDIAAMHKHYDKAITQYDMIGSKDALYWLSRLRVSEIYDLNDAPEKAVAMLGEMAKTPAYHLQAMVAAGDIYRRHEDFAHAVTAYDEALNSIDKITPEHWPIVYARGMALERLNNWDRAEKDLLTALDLQPDNPMILNYIGYTWAEKGMHLDKALDYIKRAVALRPDDGYILDSYGWALYRTGDAAGGVSWLEKAVAQVPGDTTILDHLGDAYWRTGRHVEAQFQWTRARDLSADAAFRDIVDAKLRDGLPLMPAPAALPAAKVAVHKEAKI